MEVNHPQNGACLIKYASFTAGFEDIITKLLYKNLQMALCGDVWVSNFMFRCPPTSFDNQTGETMFLVLNSGRHDYSPPSCPHKTTAIGGDRPRDERMHIDMTLFTAVTGGASETTRPSSCFLFLRWNRNLHTVRLSLYLKHLSSFARS